MLRFNLDVSDVRLAGGTGDEDKSVLAPSLAEIIEQHIEKGNVVTRPALMEL